MVDAASEAWGRHAHGWPEALQAYSQVVARVKVPGGKRYASPLWRRHPPRFHELHAWAHSHCTGAVTAQRALHVGPAPQVAGEARAAASAHALAVPRRASWRRRWRGSWPGCARRARCAWPTAPRARPRRSACGPCRSLPRWRPHRRYALLRSLRAQPAPKTPAMHATYAAGMVLASAEGRLTAGCRAAQKACAPAHCSRACRRWPREGCPARRASRRRCSSCARRRAARGAMTRRAAVRAAAPRSPRSRSSTLGLWADERPLRPLHACSRGRARDGGDIIE